MTVFTTGKSTPRVYFWSEPLNMCRSFGSLIDIIETKQKRAPDNGDLFLFTNRKGTYVKVLYYHKHGYVIHAKRLEKGALFDIPMSEVLTPQALYRALNHVVLDNPKKKGRLNIVRKAA